MKSPLDKALPIGHAGATLDAPMGAPKSAAPDL